MAALLIVLVGVGGWTVALAEVAPPNLLAAASPTPSVTPTPQLTSTPRTPTLRPTRTPEPTPEGTAVPEQSPTLEPTATEEATPAATATLEPTPTDIPIPTPTPTPTRTPLAVQYSVEAGDSLTSISAAVGVDLDAILVANGLTLDSVLIPGQILQVPRSPGIFHVVGADESLSAIAALYGVSLRDIAEANALEDPSLIYLGQRLFIPGAKALPPTPRPTATIEATAEATTTPLPTARLTAIPSPTTISSITPTRFAAAGTQVTVSAPIGTFAVPTVSGTMINGNATATPIPPKGFAGPNARLIWPVLGYISQVFGENGHTGIDIMADTGMPMVSAADGVVTLTTTSDIGYGNRIEIDNGGGISTLYAHLSVIQVTQGQTVRQGQLIGLVGESGWATGPHLHFEVRQAGVPVNPLQYLP
ncbi:MAG TPA: peptidoglycan DD-metalloendopeptidase family protein [Chloroflexota bacterium]